ncbi:hypothetical protein [Pigmentiphaga humi]|uniref:hypothetical protein n=1 Tax=Pigmentiphaga humi TaxID=2478468 RepID=UPI000F543367|nr:hypothetical protein [Pigmentiphaga humi]
MRDETSRFLVAFLIGIASMGANAQTPACTALSGEVDAGLKELAMDRLYVIDDSAPRETNRKLSAIYDLNVIQANIALMAANKCNPIAQPISDRAYHDAAYACDREAESMSGSSDLKPAPKCDRSTWQKNVEK